MNNEAANINYCSGGREHVRALRLANGAGDSPRDDRTIFVSPGNGGIA